MPTDNVCPDDNQLSLSASLSRLQLRDLGVSELRERFLRILFGPVFDYNDLSSGFFGGDDGDDDDDDDDDGTLCTFALCSGEVIHYEVFVLCM